MVLLSAFNPYKWSSDNRDNLKTYALRCGISEERLHQEHALFGSSGFFQSLLRGVDERKGEDGKIHFFF